MKTCSDLSSGQFSYPIKFRGSIMGEIQKSIEVYESLRGFQYQITIENSMKLSLKLDREAYHHLAGLQHLTDMPDISNPKSRHKIYNDIKRGKISEAKIKASVKYSEIEERIQSFAVLEEILSSGEGKIIVEFDNSKTDSKIEAKFHLFKREGIPFKGDVTFYMLFLDTDGGHTYFPVTYIVEHSNMYVRDQVLLDCTIEKTPLTTTKKLVPA